MVFIVDFEKSYNFVQWDFLDYILEKMGFVKHKEGGFNDSCDVSWAWF